MGTGEWASASSFVNEGWAPSPVSEVLSSAKMNDFMGKTLNILKAVFSVTFVFKFCIWIFLKVGPGWPPGHRCWWPCAPEDGRGWTCPKGVAGSEFCMSAACLDFECWFHLLVWFSFFPLCHFFSLSPTFCLHADKFLCFTSPKTPSSSWMPHLSELCLCLFPADPRSFLWHLS